MKPAFDFTYLLIVLYLIIGLAAILLAPLP